MAITSGLEVDMWKCWFFHKWNRWAKYEAKGMSKTIWEDEYSPFWELRQGRCCERCGKAQDRKIR